MGSGSLDLTTDGSLTIGQDLRADGRSVITVSPEGVVSIGGTVSLGPQATINGLVQVTITEEPVIQLEVEESTSLSAFGDIDVLSVGRSSVAADDAEEISSEEDLIESLRIATE